MEFEVSSCNILTTRVQCLGNTAETEPSVRTFQHLAIIATMPDHSIVDSPLILSCVASCSTKVKLVHTTNTVLWRQMGQVGQ